MTSRSTIADWLQARLESGGFTIGQVAVHPGPVLRHVDDAGKRKIHVRPEDAREIAKYDDDGNYRPLKTAPNLRHGWELQLDSVAALRLALDFFYPAALGTWIAFERGALPAVNLRDTLARQSGMYRVTQLITDAQAGEAIRERCDPVRGCIRRQLWEISPGLPSPFTESEIELRAPVIPVLCVEACNLLVADCRPIAKRNLPKTD